jgi:hypothetical protein
VTGTERGTEPTDHPQNKTHPQTLLGFTWHYRKTDQQTTAAVAASPPSAAVVPVQDEVNNEDVVTKILGPAEWLT